MNTDLWQKPWVRILCALLVLLPIAILFFLPSGPLATSTALMWLLLPVCFWLLMWTLTETFPSTAGSTPVGPRMLLESEQPAIVRQVMDVRVATVEPSGVQLFRGPLRESAANAHSRLRTVLGVRATTLLREDEELGSAILLLPGDISERPASERAAPPWVCWLLFLLTVGTTTWAGAAHRGIDLLSTPGRFAEGLPYSLGLLAILGVHELGHYFAAKHHGIRVTLPYFIPVPFALGTLGAFIQLRSPTENRKALFDVAVAGPLAGLAVAIPALLIGLRTSIIVPESEAATSMIGTSAGSSILFALVAKLSLGSLLESGHVVSLSPLAFAGWLGLLITGLNLVPIGQLDGGHISHAVFGWRLGERISSVALWLLVSMALFVWPGLLMWAILVFFIAGTAVPPLNDLTPLPTGRRWLGYAVFVILGLILMPLPHSLWSSAGFHCPYV